MSDRWTGGWTAGRATDGGGSGHSSSPLQQILPLPSHPKWVSAHPLPPFPGCLVRAPTARAGLPSLSLPICSPLSLSGASLCSSLSLLSLLSVPSFPPSLDSPPPLCCYQAAVIPPTARLPVPASPQGHLHSRARPVWVTFHVRGANSAPGEVLLVTGMGPSVAWSPGLASRVVSPPVSELLCRRQAYCLPPCPAWTRAWVLGRPGQDGALRIWHFPLSLC